MGLNIFYINKGKQFLLAGYIRKDTEFGVMTWVLLKYSSPFAIVNLIQVLLSPINLFTPGVNLWVIQSFLTFDSMDRILKCDQFYPRCNFGKFTNFDLALSVEKGLPKWGTPNRKAFF